jgi:demethylmenaquinone methyltransferase/2-methoxy-6-polyprenyl-1,4-benzoquinol methylase
MAKYSHDTIVPFKDSHLGKKEQVADMFDRIAFRYDFLNRFLSGGIDLYWRKKAIRELTRSGAGTAGNSGTGTVAGAGSAGGPGSAAETGFTPQAILDVATGTADMAILMTRYLPKARITGIDISAGMLDLGKQKIARLQLTDRVTLQIGDSEAIHFPDNSFDAITVAFGVRNFENLEKGLKEMLRVLKPGGRLVVLEFSKPRQNMFRRLYNLYMRRIAPGIIKMVSRHREAYQYLNESVRAFPEGISFMGILKDCGYTGIHSRKLSLGICTVYVGAKILL